jgi:DNA polymerase/3'-5' exonuclease PolX
MSTSDTRRSYKEALKDAEDFRALFPSISYSVWTFAGSLRRKCSSVGDNEHVVCPITGNKPNGGLFGGEVNLLFHRLDELVASREVTQHIYGATGPRWGEKYRGIDYRGVMHEIFCADPQWNYGPTLGIRTGGPEFSKRLVSGLLRNQRRNYKGRVWRCEPCPTASAAGQRCEKSCGECQGTQLKCIEAIPVATEEEYFKLCGIEFVPPERRS